MKINIEDMVWGFWQKCWVYRYENRAICINANPTDDLKKVICNLQDIGISGNYLKHPAFVAFKHKDTVQKNYEYFIDCGLSLKEICFDSLKKYMETKNEASI